MADSEVLLELSDIKKEYKKLLTKTKQSAKMMQRKKRRAI